MTNPLEFYFDFSSPYGYIAAMRIEALAARHGRSVDWRPMMLGAVFKVAGTQPLTMYPIKGQYSVHDFKRSARQHGIAFNMPASFPMATQAAARAVYWFKRQHPDKAVSFIRAVYAAYFVEGQDISSVSTVLSLGAGLGIDQAALAAGLEDPEIKAYLREVTDDAIHKRGVFGSPFIFVDGEPFWGADRLEMIDEWLRRGGW